MFLIILQRRNNVSPNSIQKITFVKIEYIIGNCRSYSFDMPKIRRHNRAKTRIFLSVDAKTDWHVYCNDFYAYTNKGFIS